MTVVVDVAASRPHYLDHVAGVWEALPDTHRGRLLVPDRLAGQVERLELPRGGGDRRGRGDVVLVAGWDDAAGARMWRRVALMEHGVGQTYRETDNPVDDRHPGYAGGTGRCGVVDVFLCPNDRVAALNRAACPGARVEVIGSPLLDRLMRVERAPRFDVGFTWHWDSGLCPETRCTFGYWQPAVVGLAGQLRVLGSAHPRAQAQLFGRYQAAGIATEGALERLVASVRVVVADNTSALFLAAGLGLPVVVLNHPGYRRHVDHGLRFWEFADVGPQVGEPGDLAAVVADVLRAPDLVRAGEIVGELFPFRDGGSARRAVEVLVSGT